MIDSAYIIEYIQNNPDETMAALFILALVIAYFVGSIPSGLILSKWFGYGDIRHIGSGNIGATNALRTGNKKLGLLTLMIDSSKGAIGVLVGMLLIQYLQTPYGTNCKLLLETVSTNPDGLNIIAPNKKTCDLYDAYQVQALFYGGSDMISVMKSSSLLLGFFAIIGHCLPIWLKFKGGKGVATSLGIFLFIVPYTGLAACAAWLITAKVTKFSSLSALIALAVAPIVTAFVYGLAPAGVCALITLLIWLRHKDNIKRLLNGTEPKIGAKKKTEDNNKEEVPIEPVSK